MNTLSMLLGLLCSSTLWADPIDPATIPESEYVTVKDGQLHSGGKRQRYWAAIGKLYASPDFKEAKTDQERAAAIEIARKGTDTLLDRFELLGFNAFRLWEGFADGGKYEKGDGSPADSVDYFIAEAKKRGMKIWVAGMNRVGTVSPEDHTIINDAATAEAWQRAIASMRKVDEKGEVVAPVQLRNNVARIWDDRLEVIGIARMTAIATHYNHHTGLRWCDDPVFGVWELSNEEWWVRKMVAGQWQKQPAFFRNSLVAKWNAFLKDKYKTDAALAKAGDKLIEGESLGTGTVALMPMAGRSAVEATLNDSNPQAIDSVKAEKQFYAREDFSEQRGRDVLEFFVALHLSHKQREAAALKKLGRSIALSPMIYDTGIGYEIQSQYLHQHADAVAHDAYVNGWGPTLAEEMKLAQATTDPHQKMRLAQDAERISRNTGPWINWLLKPPGISQGVPWLEQNRVEGKPYLCYETQIQQPAKYRADFPLRIAALASVQDWDWICWHYFAAPSDLSGETPFEQPMDVTSRGHPQGYHFTFDPTQAASMRTAAMIFRNFGLERAQKPTTFVFGRKSLFDPSTMDYAGSYGRAGLDMNYTTYQHGVRLRIDPSREDDAVEGPVVSFDDRKTHNPYTPTPQITFDWKQGFLRFDSPTAVAWTGLLAKQNGDPTFSNGLTLTNVTIRNDDGIADPVTDKEKYIAFALASDDGKPLAETKRATLGLVSTSFNTGFKLLLTPQRLSTPGTLPVLHARVGATIRGEALAGMSYRFIDFSGREIGKGRVAGNAVTVPNHQPVWIVELTRN